MKKIYIVLTHTGTVLSKIIKKYTKDEFSHVSIALNKELNRMYSFGRLNPYNPFYAGFVHEYIDDGTFKRFYKTRAKIYSLEINDDQYKEISKNIIKFELNKNKYKFNIIGLFAVGLQKRVQKENRFYCAEKDSLTLKVYQKNINAINFYKKSGFIIVNENIDESTNEVEYIMSWRKQ